MALLPDNNLLAAALILSVAVFVPYYAMLRRWAFESVTARGVRTFFVIWLLVIVAEYFVAGPASFVARETDARFLAFLHYLANTEDAGRFSHTIAGGQDLYVMMPSMQYFNPERLLMNVLPPWVVLLAHKAMIAALGFIGGYLLARRMAPGNRVIALAVAIVYPVSHIYLGNYSVEFSTGFAMLPLAAYVCVALSRHRLFYAAVTACAVVVAAAVPMKVFPTLFVAVVGVAIMIPGIAFGRVALGLVIYAIVSALNWHEVIFALSETVAYTNRGIGAQSFDYPLLAAVQALGRYILDVWPMSALMLLGTGYLVAVRDPMAKRALLTLAWFCFALVFASSFPWQSVGLALVNKMAHGYMRLAMGACAIPVAALALHHLMKPADESGASRSGPCPALAVMAFALCLLTWDKFFNAAQMLSFGGMKSRFGYQELLSPARTPAEDFRVVTLFDSPHANVTAAIYGLDSFDGAVHFNPKPWNDYWKAVRRLPFDTPGDPARNKATGKIAGRITPDWRHWNSREYAIDNDVRFDLLRAANVRFVLSPLPLRSANLKTVVVPGRDETIRAPRDFYDGTANYLRARLKRVFDPGRHYVYELTSPLPRVYVPAGVTAAPPSLDGAAFYDLVAENAETRRIVVSDADALLLETHASLNVENYTRTTDGYDIEVHAPDGGSVVVNAYHVPFWSAWAGTSKLDIVRASGAQMAIAVPPGTERIRLNYARPLLREYLAGLIE